MYNGVYYIVYIHISIRSFLNNLIPLQNLCSASSHSLNQSSETNRFNFNYPHLLLCSSRTIFLFFSFQNSFSNPFSLLLIKPRKSTAFTAINSPCNSNYPHATSKSTQETCLYLLKKKKKDSSFQNPFRHWTQRTRTSLIVAIIVGTGPSIRALMDSLSLWNSFVFPRVSPTHSLPSPWISASYAFAVEGYGRLEWRKSPEVGVRDGWC